MKTAKITILWIIIMFGIEEWNWGWEVMLDLLEAGVVWS